MTVVYKHVARPGIDIWQTWKSVGTTPDGETAYAEVVALEAGSIGGGGSGGSGGVVQQGAVDATVQPWQVTGPLTDAQLRATPVPVSGTFWQTTQPVSGPLTDTQLRASAVPVSGTFFQATQPVSGTVAVSNSFALDATLTGGTQKTKLVDTGGTNVATISAAGALKVDNSAVTQPISGTVTANIGSSGSLALDATLTGGTQKSKLVDSGGTNVAAVSAAGRLSVDASGVAVPVTDNSGSLTIDSTQLPSALGQTTASASLPVVLASDKQVITANVTDTLFNGTTALTPKWALISTSSSGASQVVALVNAKKIRVIALALTANAAVNAKFQSHVTPTDKTGLFYLAANGGFVLPPNPLGWFETVSGEALDINLSGAIAVGGVLQYVEV